MGMMGHVQFMSICAEGDMGVPNETAAMGEGMAWMNVQAHDCHCPPLPVVAHR